MKNSTARHDANRRNALHSTGPQTPAGKFNSSRNATRHGLTGQPRFSTPAESQAHDSFCQAIVATLHPADALENQFALCVAEDHFRLNRLRDIEAGILAQGDPADMFLAHAQQLQLLALYEQRINRNIQRNLAQLQALQKDRRADHDRQLEEARLLSQLSLAQGLAYDPARDGFVFSAAEINQASDRASRLRTAREHHRTAPLARAA